MIKLPDHKFTQALHQLVRQDLWKPIEDQLRLELSATYARMLDTQETAVLHALRGRAQFISEYLVLASTTQDTLKKFER